MDQLRIKGLRGIRLSRCFSSRKELGQLVSPRPMVDYEMTRAARTGDLEASIVTGCLAERLTSGCRRKDRSD